MFGVRTYSLKGFVTAEYRTGVGGVQWWYSGQNETPSGQNETHLDNLYEK